MVTITNNKETKIVTKGAYNSFYKPLGFELVLEKEVKAKPVEKNITKSDNEVKKDSNIKKNNNKKSEK